MGYCDLYVPREDATVGYCHANPGMVRAMLDQFEGAAATRTGELR